MKEEMEEELGNIWRDKYHMISTKMLSSSLNEMFLTSDNYN